MDDNHCFRLLVIRYLNPLDKNRAKSKQMIEFVKQFDLIWTEFPVTVKNYHNIQNKKICIKCFCLYLNVYETVMHYIQVVINKDGYFSLI